MPIKAVALDVDGVLTDGLFAWSTTGEESKQFSYRDVMGISIARRKGILFALISGEASPLVDRFAGKMGIEDVYKGCKDKDVALRNFAVKRGLALSEICFVGDDVNDLPALAIAGLPAAPADAHKSVRDMVKFTATAGGGHGAVREILDYIMADS
jgi:3-deoxy-D-manno-octulosonate 8-phosphate phosphatase (KDO 8-P phosphatase)